MSILETPRSILKLTLGGYPHHRRCTALIAAVASEKGWHIRDTYAAGSEGANPDFFIEKEDRRVRGASRFSGISTFGIEVIDSNDPRPNWKDRKAYLPDILAFIVTGKSLDEVAAEAEARIP